MKLLLNQNRKHNHAEDVFEKCVIYVGTSLQFGYAVSNAELFLHHIALKYSILCQIQMGLIYVFWSAATCVYSVLS